MTDLERLKLLTEELDAPGGNTETGCGCMSPPASARMYTDAQLAMLLELHEGDVRRAAYDVLIRKAENSAVRLSGGTELPDQRAYWLGRARSVRPNGTKPAGRAAGGSDVPARAGGVWRGLRAGLARAAGRERRADRRRAEDRLRVRRAL